MERTHVVLSTRHFLSGALWGGTSHFSPAPVWAPSLELQSFRKKKVLWFLREILIWSSVGSPLSCRGCLLRPGSSLNSREYLLQCCGAPSPPPTLVFPSAVFHSPPHTTSPCLSSVFSFSLKCFHRGATNKLGSMLAYSGFVWVEWAVGHRVPCGLCPQTPPQ